MSIRDILKKSVLASFSADSLSLQTVLVSLTVAALMGLFIYFFYRIVTRSSFYSRDFNKSLALLPLICTGILLAMQSSLVISLGAVGALSIVRFRNAVKSSMDLMFLFWAISTGIICGAQLYGIALLMSAIICVIMLVLDLIPQWKAPLLLVAGGDRTLEEKLLPLLKSGARRVMVKSRSLTADGTELVVELVTRDPAALVNICGNLEGLHHLELLSHDGEVRC